MNRFSSALVLLLAGLASADHHHHHHVSAATGYSSVQANPGASVVANSKTATSSSSGTVSAADIPQIAANIVAGVEKKLAEESAASSAAGGKSDTAAAADNNGQIDRSDSGYSAPSAGVAAATAAAAQSQPVSTGNLYYYYYPVAAYPLYDNQPHNRVHNQQASSSSYGAPSYNSYPEESSLSPLLFLLVPLVLLLLAIPFLGLLGVNVTGARSFDSNSLSRTVDDLLAKYVEALDSDQCMDRIFCELGVKAQGIQNIVPFLR